MRKFSKVLIIVLVAVMLFGTVQAFAFEPYDTYTYSIDGKPLKSPAAYRAEGVVDALGMNLSNLTPEIPTLNSASDIVTDKDANVYIADRGNNRVVILDKYYKAKSVISSYVDEFGAPQTFNQPQGLFVTNPDIMVEGKTQLYICDTGNFRVVVFELKGDEYVYDRTIEKPDTPVLTMDAFKPSAIAVDLYGRIFITGERCFEGVIVLSGNGDFTGFIGAQKVTYSFFELIWRRFQTKEQRDASQKKLANPYNNITVDAEGFVYVTTNGSNPVDKQNQFAAIESKDPTLSPVKKLNSAGNEIMKRNGFFDPSGEVDVGTFDVSEIIDVAVGNEGSWTILDRSRSRMFTYDQNGNLLFAFGDKGDQLGNGEAFVSMTYQVINGVYYMLLLDNSVSGYRLTVYSPTPYYDTIINALHNQNVHEYSESIFHWQDVLTQNNNFDLAYIGIGKALFNQGRYDEAQEMLESAYETAYHDKAFMEIRKDIIQKWLLLIVIAAIALIVLLVKFLGYAKKKNKAVSLKVGRKSYGEELLFAFHLLLHPFDGFWDLKHEKRGSVRAAFTIMMITIIAFFYQAVGQGYSFNPRGDYSTVAIQVIAVAIPVILWCVGNWCLTTLFDGEGSFKDIFVATGYALTPLPIFVIVSTILTNVMTTSEGSMVSLIVTLGYVWVGILLFFGMLVTHDYSINKNIATVLGTILAMAIIIFVIVLFSSLIAKMVTFIFAIFSEIANRA